MSDYTYWEKALDLTGGKRAVSRDEMLALGISEEPQCGFFRRRMERGGLLVPVAIWRDGDAVLALVDGREADAAQVFSYCCAHAVPEAWYRDKMDGKPWPDEDIMAGNLAHNPGTNEPPTDPLEAKRIEIDNALGDVDKYATVTDDDTASQAQARRSRLLDLSGEADAAREKLVRPHLDAQRDINGGWMPLIKAAKEGADKIRTALKAFETAKFQAAEKVRLAAEAEARKKAQGEAEARRKAEEAGRPIPEPVPAPEPPAPPPVAAPVIRGASGRAASKKLKKVAYVVDQDKAYLAMKTHPELRDLIAKLAQRAVDAGLAPEGVEVKEEIDVR